MLILLATKSIKELDLFLRDKISNKKIKNYRLYLMLDATIGIDILYETKIANNMQNDLEKISSVFINYEEISLEEYGIDSFYNNKFSDNDNKIDLGYKRRLSNFNFVDNQSDNISTIPIVSFYSYKGGVGRTTSLVAFANYLAYTKSKKVLMIDFDLEAPGLSNFFGSDVNNLDKNGLVEYLLDKESSKDSTLNIVENYLIEISREFTNDGAIYIMPAGNLSSKDNTSSYLEGLARIDVTGTDNIIKQIKGLMEDIKNTIDPDVILIDSRTGFNDIFGLLINRVSDVIVGVFEDNVQSRVGLEIFIDKCLLGESNTIKPCFLNSQIAKRDEYEIRLDNFKNTIYDLLTPEDKDRFDNSLDILSLRNHQVLSNLGTFKDNKDEYLDFIRNMPYDYKKYCEVIFNKVFKEEELIIENINTKTVGAKSILRAIKDNFPEPYAEEITFDDTFLKNRLFFRKCFEDIFNYDKILIIGSKGTGKTTLYSSLNNGSFLNKLKTKAGRKNNNIQVIDIISKHDDSNANKYVISDTIFKSTEENTEEDYKRFWLIYVVNSILLDEKMKKNYSTSLTSLPQELNSRSTMKAKKLFYSFIEDDNEFEKIENELIKINAHMRQLNTSLMITFDQLDFVVKPNLWNKAIVPLINFFKSNPYDKIYPKIFLRSDLYSKLSNITNKQSLEGRSVHLNWSKEEIFAFFFKTIFSFSKSDFLKIMKSNEEYKNVAKDIESIIKNKNAFNQVKIETYYLQPLVEVFFGKSASMYPSSDKVHRSPYDWFYKNLSNANGTISLRPFLDLIEFAITDALDKSDEKLPLKASYYANSNARKQCVNRYFEDLSIEKGNELFAEIIRIIRTEDFPKELKQRELGGDRYDSFIDELIKEISDKDITKKDIEDSLVHNEVISIQYKHGGVKKCIFAFLYKYFLGLKG